MERVVDDEFVDYQLGIPNAVDQLILNGPGGAKLGGSDPDVQVKQIRMRVGRRPTIRNLRRLYEVLELQCPKDLELFENYDVWIFAFKVHLMKDGGFGSVTQFGAQVRFPEDSAISIVSLLPDSEFITKGGAHLKASAALSVTGDAMIPEAAIAVGAATAKVGGDIRASVSGGAHINISMSVMTTKVLTIGTGDYVGEWSIRRGEQPLLGEQSFLSTVLVPSGLNDLEVQLRAYVNVSTGFLVPARVQTDWLTMAVSLENAASVGTDA